ncbi:hypothetical protein QWI17_15840 [Gilvimarinus sp. SDUM040013]|uniref:Secreted protein n=1 Tax=Gilvimarinus gilvus TaxID=3058038 RepID=A0ABU4RXV0_9GAMM|nr:hypothetical protein [Gilvimarinus sp. SDUM040013]MDO3387313.1 hypothetical protein [Gilvimarinus sp. SDUM040013]MDX6849002.1 hypothetical protein [Gilvimarinus sp. SDUM040013]
MDQTFASKCLFGLGILSVILAAPLVIAETDDSSQPDAEADTYQGGWTAWLDPNTGELSKEPPPKGVALPVDNNALRSFSTSDVGIVPETLPNGTVVVDLQGRFQQGTMATIDKDGNVKTQRIGGEMFLSPDGPEISRRMLSDHTSPEEDAP